MTNDAPPSPDGPTDIAVVPEGLEAQLRSHWKHIAAHAWDSYDRHGRGAVLLWEKELYDSVKPIAAKIMQYVEAHYEPGSIEEARYLQLPPAVTTLVTEYDPAKSVVGVLITKAAQPVMFYIDDEPLSPPDASREISELKHGLIAAHLRSTWLNIAAFAWTHYKAFGRGAVLVWETDFVDPHIPVSKLGLQYAADGNADFWKTWPGFRMEQAVKDELQAYDPAKELYLFVLSTSGRTKRVHAHDKHPFPPEAYEWLTSPKKAKRRNWSSRYLARLDDPSFIDACAVAIEDSTILKTGVIEWPNRIQQPSDSIPSVFAEAAKRGLEPRVIADRVIGRAQHGVSFISNLVAPPAWRRYEIHAAHAIVSVLLDGGAAIDSWEFDARIIGQITGEVRQIDLMLTSNSPIHRVACEFRNYDSAVPVADVGAYATTLEDVGANRGFMVTPVGFQASAKKIAAHKKIGLLLFRECSLVELTAQYPEEVAGIKPAATYWLLQVLDQRDHWILSGTVTEAACD